MQTIIALVIFLSVLLKLSYPTTHVTVNTWKHEIQQTSNLLGPELSRPILTLGNFTYRIVDKGLSQVFNPNPGANMPPIFNKLERELKKCWLDLQLYLFAVYFRGGAACFWIVVLLPVIFASLVFALMQRKISQETFSFKSPWLLRTSWNFLKFLVLIFWCMLLVPFTYSVEYLLFVVSLISVLAGLPILNLQKNI